MFNIRQQSMPRYIAMVLIFTRSFKIKSHFKGLPYIARSQGTIFYIFTNAAQVFLKRNQLERYLQLVNLQLSLQVTNVSKTELFHNISVDSYLVNFFQLTMSSQLSYISSLCRQQARYISAFQSSYFQIRTCS